MRRFYPLLIVILLFSAFTLSAQDTRHFNSLTTGIGFGYSEGKQESGFGLVYEIGYQRSFGRSNRFRFNPNLQYGGFLPFATTDMPDQLYRLSTLALDLHYDLARFKSLSLVTTPGIFGSYSRGLTGTGGMNGISSSEYFQSFYFGGKFSLGIRISKSIKRLAYEIRPLNIHFGSKYFLYNSIMFKVHIKLDSLEN
ncbi:MAG: hypothetical protein ABGW97_14735 [Christiangramia sp.]|uniref:hypothetical protein n=1 Tax=Christiangramia sp. TaxID=1931228 RepID=UPI003242355D